MTNTEHGWDIDKRRSSVAINYDDSDYEKGAKMEQLENSSKT